MRSSKSPKPQFWRWKRWQVSSGPHVWAHVRHLCFQRHLCWNSVPGCQRETFEERPRCSKAVCLRTCAERGGCCGWEPSALVSLGCSAMLGLDWQHSLESLCRAVVWQRSVWRRWEGTRGIWIENCIWGRHKRFHMGWSRQSCLAIDLCFADYWHPVEHKDPASLSLCPLHFCGLGCEHFGCLFRGELWHLCHCRDDLFSDAWDRLFRHPVWFGRYLEQACRRRGETCEHGFANGFAQLLRDNRATDLHDVFGRHWSTHGFGNSASLCFHRGRCCASLRRSWGFVLGWSTRWIWRVGEFLWKRRLLWLKGLAIKLVYTFNKHFESSHFTDQCVLQKQWERLDGFVFSCIPIIPQHPLSQVGASLGQSLLQSPPMGLGRLNIECLTLLESKHHETSTVELVEL